MTETKTPDPLKVADLVSFRPTVLEQRPKIDKPTGPQMSAICTLYTTLVLSRIVACRTHMTMKPELAGALDATVVHHFKHRGQLAMSVRNLLKATERELSIALAKCVSTALVARSPSDFQAMADQSDRLEQMARENDEAQEAGTFPVSLDELARYNVVATILETICDGKAPKDAGGDFHVRGDGLMLKMKSKLTNIVYGDLGPAGVISIQYQTPLTHDDISPNVFEAVEDIVTWTTREIWSASGDLEALTELEKASDDDHQSMQVRAARQLEEAIKASYHPTCDCDNCTAKREAAGVEPGAEGETEHVKKTAEVPEGAVASGGHTLH